MVSNAYNLGSYTTGGEKKRLGRGKKVEELLPWVGNKVRGAEAR